MDYNEIDDISETGAHCPICFESYSNINKIKCDQCQQEMCVYCSSKWRKNCPFCCKVNPDELESQKQPLIQPELTWFSCHMFLEKFCVFFIFLATCLVCFLFFRTMFIKPIKEFPGSSGSFRHSVSVSPSISYSRN
jgi:hypothetical protein